MENDIRWKQRFQNYEKAYHQFMKFIAKENLNEFETQGLIKSFEYTYELAWNVMKDYLLDQGIVGITGSKDAIRKAFQLGLITNGQSWIDMVQDRIRTVHTYDEETAEQIEQLIITVYEGLFTAFYHKMKTLL